MDDDHLRSLIYRHTIASRDIGQGMAGDFVRQLNSVDDDIVKEIAARYAKIEASGFDRGPATTKRLEEMLKGVRELNREVYEKASQGLAGNLTKMAAQEAKFALGAARASGIKFTNTLPSAGFFKTLVTTTPLPFSDDGHTLLMPWLEVQEAGRLRRLEGALRTGIFQGETTADLVKRIAGTRTQNGILETSRKDGTTIALTANSAIQNEARLDTFKKMKSLKFVEWSSILDSRTSQICQGRSGQIFKIDEPHPKAPAHPRCRSLLLPRRDNTGNKHQPFGDWLQAQPEDVQDEILGKERADIFRKNPNMDFQSFFKEGGGYKTLKEIREFDEKIVATPAKVAPKAEPKAPERFSPINRLVTEESIKVEKKSVVQKALTQRFAEAARDVRYETSGSSRPEYKGSKLEHFGISSLPSGMTDSTVSMIAAIMPEVNAITDRFGIPRLRGIRKTMSSRAGGDMGDGVMGFNPDVYNRMTIRNTKAVDPAKIEELNAALAKKAEEFMAARGAIEAAENMQEKAELYLKYNAVRKEYDAILKKLDKLNHEARQATLAGKQVASTWTLGDDAAKITFVSTDYFVGIDRARAIMYHEAAHHVHQMLGKTQLRRLATPPLELELKSLFMRKKQDGTLKRYAWSKYSMEDPYEYFAENFSFYMMGRLDMVDPDALQLIERLLENGK